MDLEKEKADYRRKVVEIKMKLEHLLQGYQFNKIPVEIKERMSEDSGVIKFTDDIHAAYLLDPDEIVIALEIFINCIAREMTLEQELIHTSKVIKILQQSIILLSNTTQEEATIILTNLGLFDGSFIKGKKIKLFEFEYKIEVIDGILHFSIKETVE